jgi:hypothetical protein
MKVMTKLALAVGVLFLLSSASFAQAPWWGQNNGWGYQNDKDRREYNNGYRDGSNDRSHGRSWHPRHSEQDYMNGYRAGYGSNGGGWQGRRDNDHDRDDAYRGNNGNWGNGQYGNGPYNNGPYRNGQYGNNAQGLAYNNGYQTGMNYGAADRNNGHSYRPTYSSTYQNGTSGYNSSMGSQTAYKNAFRQGYQAGYDAGFNSRGRRY